MVEKYSTELTEASRIRKEIIREAQQKAQEIIDAANKTVENTIKAIRENQAEKEKTRLLRKQMEEEKARLLSEAQNEEEERIRKKMEKLKNREKNRKEKTAKPAPATAPAQEAETALRPGDWVELPNNAIGEILELNGKNAVIALGSLRTTVKLTQLKKTSASQARKAARPASPPSSYANIRENISQKRLTFKPDIDLRGMRGEEALQKVIVFLDEAVMLNCKEVRLLHGTGTGALRQLIRQYLGTNPLVASYADEQVQLGGAGITVVQLDL